MLIMPNFLQARFGNANSNYLTLILKLFPGVLPESTCQRVILFNLVFTFNFKFTHLLTALNSGCSQKFDQIRLPFMGLVVPVLLEIYFGMSAILVLCYYSVWTTFLVAVLCEMQGFFSQFQYSFLFFVSV